MKKSHLLPLVLLFMFFIGCLGSPDIEPEPDPEVDDQWVIMDKFILRETHE